MPTLSIRELTDDILGGRIRVPAFQRKFVWDAERVAMLMDSLYKGYPIGNLLLWRTKVGLRTERQLGPFELPDRDPDYPIDYVLDGQQRLTSIFGVFQTEIMPTDDADWIPIYFDYQAGTDPQEPLFFALQEGEADPERYFPLSVVFDSSAYRKQTREFDETTAERIDAMQAQFKEMRLTTDVFETEDRNTVAIVFERVNRMGVELDTFQLLSAWTWSDDFDLQEEFSSLAESLEPFGFRGVGDDSTLLLRCCAAVVAGDASPSTLVSLNGTEVRQRFAEIRSGIEGAIDFLRRNLHVHSLSNLPFSTLLVPLAAFFAGDPHSYVALTHSQREQLKTWFWRSAFSRRYSSGVLRNLESDIAQAKELRDSGNSSLGQFPVPLDADFFLRSKFVVNSVNTKTFILLLAQEQPLSFISGQPVSLQEVLREYNRTEFHHCFPRKAANDRGVDARERDCLANFAFISAQDNRALGGGLPSKYRDKMAKTAFEEITRRALLPHELWDDDFDRYIKGRAELLATKARELGRLDSQ